MKIATHKKTRTNPQGAGRRCRTTLEREQFLTELAKYLRQGWDQSSCATMLGVSQSQISQDVKVLWKRYEDSQIESYKYLVAEQLEKLKDVRREAWEAWERSKEDTEKEVEKFAIPLAKGKETMAGSIELLQRIVTKEGRLPDNAYLSIILETFRDERELLGLDEYKGPQTVVNIQQTTVNMFDSMSQLVAVPVVDTIEQNIQQIGAIEHQSMVDADIVDPAMKDAAMGREP